MALETLWTPVSDNANQEEYGLGARIEHAYGHRFVGHGGGWPGVTNRFDMAPELGYTIVVLSNYDCDPQAIVGKIREWIVAGNEPTDPSPIRAPELSLTAELARSEAKVGVAAPIKVRVANSGGPVLLGIVDLEVKDSSGERIDQQFKAGPHIAANGALICEFAWKPAKPGAYTFDLGVFGPGGGPTHQYSAAAATVTVVP